MDRYEYERLQAAFSSKLKNHDKWWAMTNKEEAYNNGVLACKSILKSVFEELERDKN